ncbi:MocR-like pyridoxine biosynthesis transcription factor PdxR [Aliamphritea ceti]|uniref:MocR-like pyridoxine biosynthesis transcription factor PdxR n=1 Tax=Aliamphritea ceti TaxID=1524258 RepID=UPI0021C3F587|nr:PLP-dependent aminotransferase family protein [Aliamphritea ceti]
MLNHLFHLSPDSDASLQQQIREQISTAIMDGHIPCNVPLPSTRKLAEMLHVSRNTVILAYEHLIDDGYLISRERAGFYVNEEILRASVDGNNSQEKDSSDIQGDAPQWQNFLKFRPTEHKLNKVNRWQDYPYPFIYGQLDPKMFPTNHWRECCRESVSVQAISDWSGDRYDEDDPLLIEQIHSRLLPRRGVWADPEEILITVGAQHALYMILRLLLNRDACFGLEEPGYPDLTKMAASTEARIKPLAVDGDGLIVGEQLSDCNLLFTTPSHQFPTTVTMPLERRRQLLEQASRDNFLIIEDDYECEVTFADTPTPALKSLDKNDRVIYLGSLSKTLSPGLRVGYIVGPKELIREVREFRRMMLRHPPMNNQRSIGLFLARGYHDSLVRNLIQAYEARWQAVGDALQDCLPESAIPPVFGGSAYWVKGPEHLDARELKRLALQKGVVLESGDIYYYDENPPLNNFRLGYSSIATERIRPGIDRLAAIIHQLCD